MMGTYTAVGKVSMGERNTSIEVGGWWKSRFEDGLMIVAITCLLLGYSAVSNASGEMRLDEVKKGALLFETITDDASTGAAGVTKKSVSYPKTYRPAALLDEEVVIDVSGLIVTVRLTQRFKNDTEDWLEALYAFPLPENAALYGMDIRIGERHIKGEVLEKQQAKKRYQKAKKEGKKAALVEQHRPNLFTNNIANIPPGEAIEVVLEYNQVLDYKEGGFTLRFPMTTTPRYMPGQALLLDTPPIDQVTGWSLPTDQVPDAHLISPYTVPQSALQDNDHKMKLTVSVNAGFSVERFVSNSHTIAVQPQTRAGQTIHEISLAEGKVPMDRDFVMSWKPKAGKAPRAALFSETWMGEQYSLVMIMPPQQLAEQHILPREMIFVIDTSGSMGGESIRQARKSLETALASLKQTDRFNVIEFNSTTNPLFSGSVAVTPSNISRALGFVRSLQARGGTEMASALSAALSGHAHPGYLRQVVFITDGSVGNEVALFKQIQQTLGASRLFTIGIGSAPNSYFMRKAAEFGRGDFTYIANLNEVEATLEALFRKLTSPVLSDISLESDSDHRSSFQSIESYPPRIEDLYLEEPIVQVIKHDKSVDQLTLTANASKGAKPATALWQQQISLSGAKQSKGIATYWARQKIGFLNDAQLLNRHQSEAASEAPDGKSIRQQITDVALKHHLVSPYTSLVAVEQVVARPAGSELNQTSVAQVLPSGSQPRMARFPQTGTSSPLYGLIGLICYALAVGLFYQRRLLFLVWRG